MTRTHPPELPGHAATLIMAFLAMMHLAAFLWLAISPETSPFALPAAYDLRALDEIERVWWTTALFIQMPGLCVFILTLLTLRRALAGLRALAFFAPSTTGAFRRAGRLLMIYPLLSIIERPLLALALTANAGTGNRVINISIETWDLVPLLFGIVLIALASALRHAHAQERELEEIV